MNLTVRSEADDLDFDWSAPNALGPDFIPRLQKIQETGSPFWSESRQAWLITRYADVDAALRDNRFSNHRVHFEIARHIGPDFSTRYPNYYRAITHWIFNLDGAPHMRLRKLLMKPFSVRSIEQMRPAVAAKIASQIAKTPSTCDLYEDLALPFTCGTLLAVLGMEDAISVEQAIAWASILSMPIAVLGPDAAVLKTAEEACIEINQLFSAAIDDRRANPREDLLSLMVDAKVDNDSLAVSEITELFHVLLAGGFETTAKTFVKSVVALEKFPTQKASFIENMEDTAVLAKMVEELGRYIGMSGAMMRRVATDFDWQGTSFKEGDLAYLVICAANWDKTAFMDPDQLDLTAERTKQPLTFGPGFHLCLGMPLAKLSLSEALPAFYRSYEGVELLEPLVYTQNFMGRGYEKMPVRLIPRSAH